MATDREVIKELLVALGFKVEDISARKFIGTLESVNKYAAATATAIASVTAAAEVMVHRFTSEFERLYYASQRTGSTIKNLRALDFAAGQVGLSVEQVRAVTENLARTLREKPWLSGLMRGMGIDPNSKNLLTDFVKQMAKLPFWLAKIRGEQFGVDADTLWQLIHFLPQFLEAQERSKNLDWLAGFDEKKLKELAESSVHFNNTAREIWKTFGVMSEVLEAELLPYLHSFDDVLKQVLLDVMSGDLTIWNDAWRNFGLLIGLDADNVDRLVASIEALLPYIDLIGKYDWISRALTGHNTFRSQDEKDVDNLYGNGATGRSATGKIKRQSLPAAPGDKAWAKRLMSKLESDFGLPQGLLFKVWGKESAFGSHTETSSAGAKGQFQFKPETGERYGLKGADFYNIQKSAQAAAHYIADLTKQYGGNLNMAMGAYHGEKDFASRYKLGAPTSGFSPYVRGTAGERHVIINQKTDINVQGTSDPQTTAKHIGAEQSRVNGDIVRSFSAVPR